MVVYADVLFAINLLADYVLLRAGARLWNLSAARLRLLGGAAVGALLAVASLWWRRWPLLSFWLTVPGCAVVTAAAFAPCGLRVFLRAMVSFYVMSFCMAGFFLLIWQIWRPPGLYIQNNVVYYPVPLPLFFALLCLFYGVMAAAFRCTGPAVPEKRFCRLLLTYGGRTVSLKTKLDTGCDLREPFSGLPVLVVQARALRDVLPAELAAGGMAAGMRLVPYAALGGEGVLPAFRPAALCAADTGRPLACWVAVSFQPLGGDGFSALLHPDAL